MAAHTLWANFGPSRLAWGGFIFLIWRKVSISPPLVHVTKTYICKYYHYYCPESQLCSCRLFSFFVLPVANCQRATQLFSSVYHIRREKQEFYKMYSVCNTSLVPNIDCPLTSLPSAKYSLFLNVCETNPSTFFLPDMEKELQLNQI